MLYIFHIYHQNCTVSAHMFCMKKKPATVASFQSEQRPFKMQTILSCLLSSSVKVEGICTEPRRPQIQYLADEKASSALQEYLLTVSRVILSASELTLTINPTYEVSSCASKSQDQGYLKIHSSAAALYVEH